eukprot:CAMPEP_0194191842 /NCGR_PEP_ID=MMETSP0154-20130528/68398_1 /TAXON_ID=1049557 /ORGANISM="Thalassiothrix antarctica, Strain L6-D1" /LENGTH=119 /DNA_ID=CAMNT_0038914831 /DNA_START=45 /DNA_END=401 /DNA_ORIENTATION=-
MAGSTLRFEGRAPDVITIILKRSFSTLEQLQKIEPIAQCISQCGRKINNDIITNNNEEEDNKNGISKALRSAMRRSSSYGGGGDIYQISVTRCVNLLGPTAEPRHVYATLRRLESSGIM